MHLLAWASAIRAWAGGREGVLTAVLCEWDNNANRRQNEGGTSELCNDFCYSTLMPKRVMEDVTRSCQPHLTALSLYSLTLVGLLEGEKSSPLFASCGGRGSYAGVLCEVQVREGACVYARRRHASDSAA